MSRHETASIELFGAAFEIHSHAGVVSLDHDIESLKPSAIFFDFDFPTKIGLQLLQRTKQSHPGVPLLMLTVQHSESLAVWAFRSKVWDYLVKPISKLEAERTIIGLLEMLQMRALQREPRSPTMAKSLIPVEYRASGSTSNASLLLATAIEYVERNFRDKVLSSEVAALCSMTPFQFSRSFRETYSMTFQHYLLRYRMREACRLLKNPVAEISEVALLSGFNDPSYFGKTFRRYFFCSPSEYQTAQNSTIEPDLIEDIIGKTTH